MKIVVIGGTGLIGSKVVGILRSKGSDVVAAAPNTGVDTISGAGLLEALTGASVVVDVSNSPSLDGDAALEFFRSAGANIAAAEKAAGVQHHVALSVVGTDRLPDNPYLRAKQVQEDLIWAAATPYTIVRATQFFEFMRGLTQTAAQDGVVRLPHVLFQPMAADDVAQAIAGAALAAPVNDVIEVGGPDKFYMDELAARVLEFDGDPRPVRADPDARYFGARIDDSSLVPGPDAVLGATRFQWWLENVPPPLSAAPAAIAVSPARA